MIAIAVAFAVLLCGRTFAFLADPGSPNNGARRRLETIRNVPCSGDDGRIFCNMENSANEGTELAVGDTTNLIGRRQWLHGVAISSAVKSIAAHAEDSSLLPGPTFAKSEDNAATKSAICDSTVESYRKGSKQIHIIGTAHISSVSAQLSREAVRETKPDAVFIELDLQRLGRAFRNGQINRPITIVFLSGENLSGGGTFTLQSAILAPQNLEKRSGGLASFLHKMAPKNPIQDMYEGLEAQGITPGEEFINAIEEGVRLDSLIILGDRRLDITLRRLANAIVFHTDPRKLVEADRIITLKLKARMPELSKLEEELKLQKRGLSNEELALLVEGMKTKETTIDIMKEIQRAAPELYQALVGERDLIMARGMNASFSPSMSSILPPKSMSLSPSSIRTMVAVIGLGHLSGVGRELKSLGWRKFNPAQCYRMGGRLSSETR